MKQSTVTLLPILALAIGCSARADTPKGVGSPPPVTVSPPARAVLSAADRARSVIDKQLKALPSNRAAFLATLAKDAVVMLPNFAITPDDPDLDLVNAIAATRPDAEMKRAKLVNLVASGDSSMVWLAAELEIDISSAEPGEAPVSETRKVRAVELLDAASDWKVVAGSFTLVRALDRRRKPIGPIPVSTPPGPLVKLLADPDKLASLLSADPVVVFGTDKDERAVDHTAAKALVSKWRKLPLAIEEADRVREVRTAKWGYALADVNIPKAGGPPYRMSAFLIATPGTNGTWSVVAVNYGAL